MVENFSFYGFLLGKCPDTVCRKRFNNQQTDLNITLTILSKNIEIMLINEELNKSYQPIKQLLFKGHTCNISIVLF